MNTKFCFSINILLLALFALGVFCTNANALTEVSGNIDKDTTWSAAQSPYVIKGGVTVNSGVTLSIESGVVIKFGDSSGYLQVDGILDTQGTAEKPVVFTSFYDDEYGGDTNNDSDASAPSPGNWGYIQINNSENNIHHCVIRYGGNATPMLQIPDAKVTNCSITDTWYAAIQMSGNGTISNCVIQRAGTGIVSSGRSAVIQDNKISECSDGIYISGSPSLSIQPTISGNTIEKCGYPLKQENYSFPLYKNNQIIKNTYQAIGIWGSIDPQASQSATWGDVQGLGLPYVVLATVTVGTKMTLSIESGVVIKFSGASLTVNGILDTQGTAEKPIVFTSVKDDKYGGDTNNDSDASVPSQGDWGYIQINNSENNIHHCVIRYGGYICQGRDSWGNCINPSYYPMLQIPDAKITNCSLTDTWYAAIQMSGNGTISNCVIQRAGTGIVSSGRSAVIQDNKISECSDYGIHISGSPSLSTQPTISGNTIEKCGYPLKQENYSFPSYKNNQIIKNSYQAIGISGSIDPQASQSATWGDVQGLGLPYIMSGSISIGSKMTLSIEPGVVIKFGSSYTYLSVNGILDLQSTAEKPIVFTSFQDDEYGGDTNNDSDASVPSPGDWGYIQINNSENNIHHCVIRYGGIRKEYSGGYDRYYDCPMLWIPDVISKIANCSITDAKAAALSVSGKETVKAENNWWGDASGPKHTNNPNGKGSEIEGNVDYEPWLTEPPGPKPVNDVLGDVNGDRKVDSADALLILQYSLGLVRAGHEYPNLVLAIADVSGDGTISPYDASLILRFAAGYITKFPVEKPQAPPLLAFQKMERWITLESVNLLSDIVSIPIVLDEMNGIFSGRLTVAYDPRVLMPVSVVSLYDGNESVFTYEIEENRIELAFARVGNTTGKGIIAHLNFRRVPQTAEGRGNPLSLINVQLNESNISVRIISNDLSEQLLIPKRSSLLPNYPNPFNPETWIPFQLAQDVEVTISIYNFTGQLIRTLNLGKKKTGMYRTKDRAAYWDGRNEDGEIVSSNIYFYAIRAGTFRSVRKMTMMK